MRDYSNNYQSEFESEFDMEFELEDSELELEDSEFEYADNEYEDSESDNEFEDSEFEHDSENDLESRLYEVLNGDHESEFEFEQQLNKCMHEVERDYFSFKKLAAFAKKVKNNPLVRKGISMALKSTPLGAALSALPLEDIAKAASQMSRKTLRSGLTQLATNYAKDNLGGIGNMLSGATEGEYGNDGVSRGQVRNFLEIAEKAYENLAYEIDKAGSAKTPQQVQSTLQNAPKTALSNAKQYVQQARQNGQSRRHKQGNRTVIRLRQGAKVIVTAGQVVIIEP